MPGPDDTALFVNTETIHTVGARRAAEGHDDHLAGLGLAMSLAMGVYMPTREPFDFDPISLAARLKGPDCTPENIAALKEAAAEYFTILADGRWVPSPDYFSASDGNVELSSH